jgi:hypothetical protein
MRVPVLRPSVPLVLLLSLIASGPALRPAPAAVAQSVEAEGSLVSVSVSVDGASTPLYPRGGRWYLEAREGSEYAVQVANRTSERLGVALVVDGLDAVSGDRRDARRSSSPPGRLYVLDPWGSATVRGWRTSLDDVQRFTFVDEAASYAERSGKANARMGWIEVLVYRERERPPVVSQRGRITPGSTPSRGGAREERDPRSREDEAATATPSPTPEAAAGAHAPAPEPEAAGGDLAHPERSYPGTGWGAHAYDPVTVVRFEPERRAAERITLRYEYLDTLITIGVLPRPWQENDRLARRERGEEGFAPPPIR